MAIPYKTLKPFTFNGVQFKTGDLFLPELFNTSQYKLTQLVSNRHLSIVTDATEQDVKKAKKRIEAAIAGKEHKEDAPAPVKKAVEKEEQEEPLESYEEEGEEHNAANPEKDGANVVPATEVPSVDVEEEEEVAEEGEESKPATSRPRRRS